MPDIITQAELRGALEAYNAMGQRMLDFRDRLNAGAFVEPGELHAHDPQEQPIDMEPTAVMSMYGLDIMPVGRRSELYNLAAEQKNKEASKTSQNWWTATDPESMYQLSFRGEDCSLDPHIELTRAEFITLKEQLAEMRGYRTPTEAAHAS